MDLFQFVLAKFAASTSRLGAFRASEHPLGRAIVDAAVERKIVLDEVMDFDSPIGRGAVGRVNDRKVVLGNARFLGELGISATALEAEAERLREDGATAIYLAVNGKASGIVAIADPAPVSALLQTSHHPIFVTFIVAMSRGNRRRTKC